MRLRKTMKRTAAAVLALSMAVSAAAMPASAGFNIDMSKVDGDVEITQADDNGSAKVTIKVGGTDKTIDFSDGKEGNDVTITGDNTKPAATESLNAAEENADEAENADKNTSEAQKPGEAGKSGEGKGEDDEPTTQELLAPEDEEQKDEQKDEQKPADTQETEQDEKPTDQVLLCGQNDPEADKEATKQETKEKKAAEEKSYEDTPAPTSLSESVQAAANNVVSIINNSASILKVILRDLKVDAGDRAKNAMTITGNGDVTLELEGKNELKGGSASLRKGSGIYAADESESQYDSVYTGKLTIQGKEGSSLSATGGLGTDKGGNGIRAGNLDLVDATVTATGGSSTGEGGYGIRAEDLNLEDATVTATGGSGTSKSGYGIKAKGLNLEDATVTATGADNTGVETTKDSTIKNSKLIANGGIWTNGKFVVGEGGEVIAIGNSKKVVDGDARGGNALGFWDRGSGYEVQKGGKLTAIGGNAESENGKATGGDALWGEYGGIVSAGETTLIGGNAKSGSGVAVAGNAISGDSYYFTQVTVKEGTFTALGGKAESASGEATNGNSVNITPVNGNDRKTQLKVEEGGTLVTAKPDGSDENGNGITGKIEINTDGGKIEEVKNAKVVKKDDGTVEVVGELVGVETGNLKYELTATVQPTCTTPGKRVFTCTTEDKTYEETIDALGHDFVDGVCTRCGAPEQAAAESNGGSSAVTLTVTGAEAYETSIADGRYTVAVPAETAVLSGSLGNLKELKAQGVNTLVFRTQLRETALDIDSMLSLGVDDTLFTLTHNGEGASLTIGGFEHNELLH